MSYPSIKKQAGFTLVEIAIVLVIIGLLLGGVLKGQELINSAKAKSIVNDFRTISTMVYSYQDRFRYMPGDDPKANDHVGGTNATTFGSGDSIGNGRISGAWDSKTATDESALVWQHVRLANLSTGPTTTSDADYYPRNAENGQTGITSYAPANTKLHGTFFICTNNINARLARQIDATMDDGNTNTGTVQALDSAGKLATVVSTDESNGQVYTVCAAY